MCLRISLSKYFMMVGVNAMGWWSLKQDTGDFLGTGIGLGIVKNLTIRFDFDSLVCNSIQYRLKCFDVGDGVRVGLVINK